MKHLKSFSKHCLWESSDTLKSYPTKNPDRDCCIQCGCYLSDFEDYDYKKHDDYCPDCVWTDYPTMIKHRVPKREYEDDEILEKKRAYRKKSMKDNKKKFEDDSEDQDDKKSKGERGLTAAQKRLPIALRNAILKTKK